jgi:surface antigen
MSPALLIAAFGFNKRYLALLVTSLFFITALPVIAVFSLGSAALAFLNGGGSGSTQSAGLYEGPLVPGDTYAWGNCTYWAFYLRLQAGDPIPTSWGNAATWATRAATDGYLVDQTPTPGAVMQTANSDGGIGHVAYVESVDSAAGTWTISEMNYLGLDIIDTRTLPVAAAIGYEFIHDKVAP